MLENPEFEEDIYSRTATGSYKVGHDSLRLFKRLIYHDQSYYDNMNHFD